MNLRIGALPRSSTQIYDDEGKLISAIGEEVEVDTELSGIDDLDESSILFMYFQVESTTDPGTFAASSCDI